MEKPQSLLVLHIPKCGGTTFVSAINKNYSKNEIFSNSKFIRQKLGAGGWTKFPVSYREELARKEVSSFTPQQLDKIKVIIGHMNFGWHNSIDSPCQYYTMLREPVSRVISHYRFLLDKVKHPHSKIIRDQQLNVADFCLSGTTFSTDNDMTRRISGIGETVPFGECNIQHLKLAKSNIENYFISVGILESFEESLLLLHKLLNWQGLPFFTIANKSISKHPNLSQKELDSIAEFNHLDIQLYQFCKQRFTGQLSVCFDDIAYTLKRFQAENHRLNSSVLAKIKYNLISRAQGKSGL